MSYGGRYIRMAAGDPGFFSGLVKTVSKAVSPVAKVVGAATKIPVLGNVLKAVPGVGTAISLVGAGTQALGIAKKAVGGLRAGGVGSPITSGPLMVGGKNLLPSRPGIGPVVMAGGATALGAAGGIKLLQRKPATQSQGKRSRATGRSTATRGRCGCKKGTRKVCFRTGRSSSRRGVSARQAAARRRFAAAARRGPIRKGTRL